MLSKKLNGVKKYKSHETLAMVHINNSKKSISNNESNAYIW